jgi:hypothetical protein
MLNTACGPILTKPAPSNPFQRGPPFGAPFQQITLVVEGEEEELAPAEVEEVVGEGSGADGERGGGREASRVKRGEGLEGGAGGRGWDPMARGWVRIQGCGVAPLLFCFLLGRRGGRLNPTQCCCHLQNIG